MGRLDDYFREHGHYPTARLDNGSIQRVELSIAPGYARIFTYPYGSTTHIVASTWERLIDWAQPLTALQGEDFDVKLAVEQSFAFEEQLRRDARVQKIARYGRRRRR